MNHNITPHPSELPALLKPESTLRIPIAEDVAELIRFDFSISEAIRLYCKFSIGDTVIVREEWARAWYGVIYKSTHKPESYPSNPLWQPAETMPPEFSRLHHEVTDIQVQKLGDMHISDPDIYNWVITMKEAQSE